MSLSTPPPTGPPFPATQTSPGWQHLHASVLLWFAPSFPPITASSNPSPVTPCSFKMTFKYHPLYYIITVAAHHSFPGSLTEIPRPSELNGSDLIAQDWGPRQQCFQETRQVGPIYSQD